MKLKNLIIEGNAISKTMLMLSLLWLVSCTGAIKPPQHLDVVYKLSVNAIFEDLYDRVYKTLEESKFYVVKELNISASLKHYQKRWGDNYNKNGYEDVRTLVLCNPWYANEILNLSPGLMVMCPLSVTFLHKGGTTTILYGRRAPLAEGTPAHDLFNEIDSTIIGALKAAANP